MFGLKGLGSTVFLGFRGLRVLSWCVLGCRAFRVWGLGVSLFGV